ncbi:MAG: kelch repeat-containing protein [Polyangiales bacterium]
MRAEWQHLGLLSAVCGSFLSSCAKQTPDLNVRAGLASTPPRARSFDESVDTLLRVDASLARRLAPRPDGFTASAGAFDSAGVRGATSSGQATIAARVPSLADGPWQIALAGGIGAHVSLVPEHLAPAPATLDGGRVIYTDVLPSTDAVYVSDARSTELVYRLRDAAAPTDYSWRVELDPGLRLHSDPDGGASILDGRGAAKLTIAPPFAIDARGVRRDARLTVQGDRLRLHLETRGLTPPILLDPYVGTARWMRQVLSPTPRNYGTMAAVGTDLVLFSGGAAFSENDTWIWSGSQWTQRTTATSPPPRWNASSVSLGGHLTLFGGWGPGELDDTWTFDGSTWTELHPAHSPPPRDGAAMTVLDGKIVLFGDATGTGDIWEFDGSDWIDRSPSPKPTFAAPQAVTIGSTVYLLCSDSATSSTALWEWDGTTLKPSSIPTPEYFWSRVWGVAGGQLVEFASWSNDGMFHARRWNGSAWVAQDAPYPVGYAPREGVATTSVGGRVVGFGGQSYRDIGGPPSGYGYFDDMWSYDGTTLAPVIWQSAPSPRRNPSMGTLDDRVVLFGGVEYLGDSSETWEWDGVHWSKSSPTSTPSPRNSAALSGAGTTALLFGGTDQYNSTYLTDTWSWNHTEWTELTPATVPSALTVPTLARIGSVDVLVEGASWVPGSAWTWDGTDWTNVAAPSSGGLFSAYQGHGIYVDLDAREQWRWDSTAFAAEPVPTSSYLPKDSISNAVEFDRFVVAMLATTASDNQAFAWDGVAWGELSLAGLPPLSNYGVARQGANAVLFGGQDAAGVFVNDTYVLSTVSLSSGAPCKVSAECDTGLCVDGYCCNQGCIGPCEACDVPGTAGTCTPIVGAPKHGTCSTATGSDPCTQTLCDGKVGSSCAGYVGADVQCRVASCASGSDVAAAICNGTGACPNAVTHDCTPFTCGAEACRSDCRVDADCVAGLHCDAGKGQCVSGSTCVDDRTVAASDGSTQSCAPYRCAAAACIAACASSNDCLGGFVCDEATRACVTGGPSASGSASTGGCTVASTRQRRSVVPVLLAVMMLTRRRRPSAGQSTTDGARKPPRRRGITR